MDIEKKTVVDKLPNTLIIHLQRIIFDMDTFMNKKLNNRIEFPNVLNMRAFMKDHVLKGDKEKIEQAKKAQKELEKKKKAEEVRKKGAEDGKEDDEDVMMMQTSAEVNNQEIEEEQSAIKDKEMEEEEPD